MPAITATLKLLLWNTASTATQAMFQAMSQAMIAAVVQAMFCSLHHAELLLFILMACSISSFF